MCESVLFLDIGKFEAVAFLLVNCLEVEGEEEGEYAKACKYDQWYCVVVGDEVGACFLGCYYGRIVGIGACKQVSDNLWNEAETDILYPEYETVGRTQNLLIDNLGDTGPQSCRNEGKADAKQHDGAEGQQGALGLW